MSHPEYHRSGFAQDLPGSPRDFEQVIEDHVKREEDMPQRDSTDQPLTPDYPVYTVMLTFEGVNMIMWKRETCNVLIPWSFPQRTHTQELADTFTEDFGYRGLIQSWLENSLIILPHNRIWGVTKATVVELAIIPF